MTAPFDVYERAWVAWLIYTPLQFNFSWEARILCLLPGSTSDKIAVSLHNGVATDAEGLGIIDEDRQQEYEALSYTWGQPIFEESIKVNGVLFSITANLHQALLHFRHSSKPRWLWIDALCINQYDVVEKPGQIRNMMNIYRKAEQVLIYLGPARANTKIAMKFLQRLEISRGNDLEIELASKTNQRNETRLELWCKQLAEAFVPANDVAAIVLLVCEGLHDLAHRDWPRRAWIVQEVFAARTIMVHCGAEYLSWRCMIWCYEVLTLLMHQGLRDSNPSLMRPVTGRAGRLSIFSTLNLQRQLGNALRKTYDDKTLRQLTNDHWNHTSPTARAWKQLGNMHGVNVDPGDELLNLLSKTRYSLCLDDRDRVYAMLGVAGVQTKVSKTSRGTAASILIIDYSQTVAEVYTSVLNYAINSARSLQPWLESWQTSVDQFPSFVPDWRYCQYQPTKAQQESAAHVWTLQQGSTWHLRGVQLGIVTQASPPDRKSGFGPVACSVSAVLQRMIGNVHLSEAQKYKFSDAGHASAMPSTSNYERQKSMRRQMVSNTDESADCIGYWLATDKGATLQGTANDTVQIGDIVAHVVGLPEGKPVQLTNRRFVEGTSSYRAESRRSSYLTLRPRPDGGYTFLGFANLVLKEGKYGRPKFRETLELQWLIKMFVEDENDDTYRQEVFEIH